MNRLPIGVPVSGRGVWNKPISIWSSSDYTVSLERSDTLQDGLKVCSLVGKGEMWEYCRPQICTYLPHTSTWNSLSSAVTSDGSWNNTSNFGSSAMRNEEEQRRQWMHSTVHINTTPCSSKLFKFNTPNLLKWWAAHDISEIAAFKSHT